MGIWWDGETGHLLSSPQPQAAKRNITQALGSRCLVSLLCKPWAAALRMLPQHPSAASWAVWLHEATTLRSRDVLHPCPPKCHDAGSTQVLPQSSTCLCPGPATLPPPPSPLPVAVTWANTNFSRGLQQSKSRSYPSSKGVSNRRTNLNKI